jgi:outer membrane receptor protein involved in Fe transport
VLRQRRNAGLIKAWGVEGDASADLSEALSVRAAFSWTDAEVDGGSAAPQLTGLRPPQTARLTATAGAAWKATDSLRLSTELRYEGTRFEDDQNLRRLSPALGVDVRAAWRFSDEAEVYLAAENVFDANIEVGETADGIESFAAPRLVRIGFSFRR